MKCITVGEAKEKICPFMNSNMFEIHSWEDVYKCNTNCMAWEYTTETKQTNLVTITKENNKVINGDVSLITPAHKKVQSDDYGEYFEYTSELWAVIQELPKDEKIGYCIRLRGE